MTTMIPATRKQRFLLYILTKNKEMWDAHMTVVEASEKINQLKRMQQQGKVDQQVQFELIWKEAMEAGQKAMDACTPTPMVVQQHTDMLDNSSPVQKQWVVEGGVCGFAWVNIKPATTAFAKWLVSKGYAKHDSYQGGLTYWVTQGGQSMQRKEAFADAVADALQKHGISAYSMSRID